MIKAIGWTGAGFMACASFLMAGPSGPVLAIMGLLLLTIQAKTQGLYNLVILNVVSIIGFLWSLLT